MAAIVSNKFMTNYAYFQIVMLSYNIGGHSRCLRDIASCWSSSSNKQKEVSEPNALQEMIDNTIRIARLKLLFIAAKITGHSNTYEVKYSEHDSRVSGLFGSWGILMNVSGR